MKLQGFVDLHTHGFGRYDTRTTDPEAILKMAELHAKAGASAVLPTIYSGSMSDMREQIEAVRRAMEMQKATAPHEHAASILGVHLEGPFLNPLRSGALREDSFIRPSLNSLKKLLDGHEEVVRIMTIAPEIPGALRVIEASVARGIRVNMGHSEATLREALEGKSAGATGVTHIFNAMRPFHHREPGLAGFGMLDRDTYSEVIADGVHLHRETLKLIFSVKRWDRIVLVSDSVKGAKIAGKPLHGAEGVLIGGGGGIADAVHVLEEEGIPLEAIREAGIVNPRRMLGMEVVS
ncbi:MAG TPA: amidohydrolase family protein [Thermodesulfovibrionales bacterium]|nr:amidohydrolase family protein [Thermodesulfovibrionales bacterium]